MVPGYSRPHITWTGTGHTSAHVQREGRGAPALLSGGDPATLRMAAVYAAVSAKMVVSPVPLVPSSQVLAVGSGIHKWGEMASY